MNMLFHSVILRNVCGSSYPRFEPLQKLRVVEIKPLTQEHVAGRWWSQETNSGQPESEVPCPPSQPNSITI